MAKKRSGPGGKREGAGRPRELKAPVQRWIQLEQREADRADKRAAAEGISFAALVRRAIRAYLRSPREK